MVNTITVWNGPDGEVPIWYAPRDELEDSLSYLSIYHSKQNFGVILAIKAELKRRDKIWGRYHANT